MSIKHQIKSLNPLLLLCAIFAIVVGLLFIYFYPRHLATLELDAQRARESKQIEEGLMLHGKSVELRTTSPSLPPGNHEDESP